MGLWGSETVQTSGSAGGGVGGVQFWKLIYRRRQDLRGCWVEDFWDVKPNLNSRVTLSEHYLNSK